VTVSVSPEATETPPDFGSRTPSSGGAVFLAARRARGVPVVGHYTRVDGARSITRIVSPMSQPPMTQCRRLTCAIESEGEAELPAPSKSQARARRYSASGSVNDTSVP
jgi:hypothetical protein